MSSWYSRVAPGGLHWIGGDGMLTLGGQDAGPGKDFAPGYGPKWIDATTFLAAVGADLVRFALDGGRDVLNSTGHVYCDVAPDGRWIIENTKPQRIIWHDGGEWPGFATPAISNTRWAALIKNGGALIAGRGQGQDGEVVDGPNCLEPRLSGDVLVWRKELEIFGQVGHQGDVQPLTIPGEEHFWPVPVVVGGKAYVLTNTNSGRLLFYPFGSTKGYEVTRGVTDFADAQPIDDRFVRVVWSEKGEHRERTIDLTAPQVDLTVPVAAPDVPFRVDPAASFDLSDWLASCTAQQGEIYWWRKNDPVFGKPWGAWMRLVDGMIGLLADSSTGQFLANDQIDAMYFAGPYLWAPLKGKSGWQASYVTDFIWDSHVDRAIPVKVGMECGYGRFGGIETHRRHIYDPRRPDPKNAKRKTGWLEYAYIADDGVEFRFEEWADDENGVLVLHRAIQPTPRTGKEAFVAPLRPQPYPQIVATGPKPTITIRDDYGPKVGKAPLTWEATAITTGKIEQIVWRWRKQGSGEDWIRKEDDGHTTVTFTSPGTYLIGVDAYGPNRLLLDGTSKPRLIEVTA